MKKFLFLSLLSVLVISCKEENVQTWDDLTAAQRAEIQERAAKQCRSDYQATYNRFKSTSSSDVFSSSDYNREKGFYHELKEGEAVKRKADIRVWKRNASTREVYFYITENIVGSNSYFLRITETENDDMIDDLFEDHCLRTFTSTTGDNGPLKVVYEFDIPNSPNTDEYTDTYSFPFSNLAFFGNYRLSRNVRSVKIGTDDQVGEVVKYVSASLVNKTYDFDGNNNYADTNHYVQKFCTISQVPKTDDDPTLVYRVSNESSVLGGYPMTCVTTLPAGWDLSI